VGRAPALRVGPVFSDLGDTLTENVFAILWVTVCVTLLFFGWNTCGLFGIYESIEEARILLG
jgi:hypothetical protein